MNAVKVYNSSLFFGSPTFNDNEGYNIQKWRVRLSPESVCMFYKNIAHKFMGLTRVCVYDDEI